MEIIDESCDVFDPDWETMASKALKAGYAEGRNSAKDSLFQQGFDAGFEVGLQSGYYLGVIHGTAKMYGNLQNTEIGSIKNDAAKGNCVICKNEDLLLKESIKEVKNIQETANNSKFKECHNKYQDAISQMNLS